MTSPSFEEFVLASSASLHRTALLLTRDPVAAQDLLQEALLKAWRSWDRVRDTHEGYVRTILTREYLSGRRRRWVGEQPTAVLPDTGSVGGPDPDTRLTLLRAVDALPPQQRTVVVLRYFHDLTEAQTAQTMGVAVGTVKAHHTRALAALRISEHLGDETVAAGGKAL